MDNYRNDPAENGLHRIGDQIAEKAEHAESFVHELGAAAVDTGKHAVREVKQRAGEVTKDVKALYADGAEVLRDKVTKQPIAAIGLAMLAGAVVSNLLLRR